MFMPTFYDASKILERFEKIVLNENLAFHIADPDKRYVAFHRLMIDCMVLLELYPLSERERQYLALKEHAYSEHMNIADKIIDKRAKKKYGPFCVVKHDNIGMIVENQEAIHANALRLHRFTSND